MRTDILNIFLMLIAASLALVLPFEIFLISYAALGPLHYLTEISWLQKKQYFVGARRDCWFFLAICLLVALAVSPINLWAKFFTLAPSLVFFTFALAFILVFFQNWWARINAIAISLLLVLIFQNTQNYTLFFGILLTTIIHVWLFTGIFMLAGTIKSKNISGYAAFVVFLLCSATFFFVVRQSYAASTYAANIFNGGAFALNQTMLQIFNFNSAKNSLINSSAGLKIQGFIAFAYTYHYLNWFSKVEIIKWHNVKKEWLICAVLAWLASISLYAYDYKLGLSFLFFLSILHVFLEFPLNFRSMVALVKSNQPH